MYVGVKVLTQTRSAGEGNGDDHMTDDEYDELFRSVYPRLVAMGLAMSAPRHVAQELAQETLFRAYRKREELSGYDSPVAWCRRVMGNLLIDQHRRRTSEQAALEHVQSQADVDAQPAPATDPAHLATTQRWNDLMAPLSAQQRAVATLYYAEDQSVSSVAQTLGIATGTVKSALSKVRANLRQAVQRPDTSYGEEAWS